MRDGALDGLRGLAVLLVLASHSSFAGYAVFPGVDVRGIGRAGVFLFFVLSSQLLTAQCLEFSGQGPRRWGRFAARRLLRIAPAYALTIGLYVALGAFTPAIALKHAALVRAEGHFWTIPVEVLFYLSLPVLATLLGRLRTVRARASAVVILAVSLRLAFPPDYPARAPDFRPIVAPFLPVFLAGSLVAVLRAPLSELKGPAARALQICGWIALLALFPLTPSFASLITGEEVSPTRFHFWFDVFGVLFAIVVAAALPRAGGGRSALARAASFAPLRHVGEVSYSVYLLHRIVFDGLHPMAHAAGLPDALIGPVSIAAAIAVGTVAYRAVERPFLKLLRGTPSRS